VQLLEEHGVWARLEGDVEAQAEAVRIVQADLRTLIAEQFLTEAPLVPSAAEVMTPDGLRFLQEYFFLILFRSIFASVGVPEARLKLYAELNFCIKGTITAADNIFDDQAKTLLPFAPNTGARFMSILQLMSFERLLRRVLERGRVKEILNRAECDAIQRELLDRMALIGRLEGSEEGGVKEIPRPEAMLENVHRIRGGDLFALAFAAPSVLEGGLSEKLCAAEYAVAQLGTAFQIVDDLTDFEVDVGRRSNNLLVSQIHHHGSKEEKETLVRLWADGEVSEGLVEALFLNSAGSVLDMAYSEARAAFTGLVDLGYWFDPSLAEQVVHAIVGLDGVLRMESLTIGG
tara:strand:- start:1122 stop:2159 length:1038 start_codon:yes stop_codon:yes gene_type:complete